MKIELLYCDGCPSWLHTRADSEAVLAQRGLTDTVNLINVQDNEQANELRFTGSPTLRIDGVDIDPDTPPGGYDDGFNMECRIYWVDGKPTGLPPREWIERAIDAVQA
jgi:hypothetical protein